MNACEHVVTKEVSEHRERLENLIAHYNSKRLLVDSHGIIGGKNQGKAGIESLGENSSGVRALERLVKNVDEGLVLDDSFVLTPAKIRRVKMKIDKAEAQLGKKFGYIGSILKLPDAIVRKVPALRDFQNDLHKAKNFERLRSNDSKRSVSVIGSNLRQALFADGAARAILNPKIIKDIRNLENKARQTDDPKAKLELSKKVDEAMKSTDAAIIRDFVFLMNKNDVEFKSALKSGVTSEKEPTERLGKAFDANLLVAVNEARGMLKNLGGTGVNSFFKLRDAVWLKVTGKTFNENKVAAEYMPELARIAKSVDEAIKRLQAGIDEGGYFPQVAVSDVIELKGRLNQILTEENSVKISDLVNNTARDMDTMIQINPPDNLKARNTSVDRKFSEDPLFVLEHYAAQAIQFNKLNTVAVSYQKILKQAMRPGVESEFLGGAADWMHDQYTVSTKGLMNRPDWINKTTRTLKVLEAVKAMGFGVPGAVRNVVGSQFFLVNMGLKRIKASRDMYENGVIGNTTVKKLVSAIEQEQGFKFGDIATELVAQGIIAKEGAEKLDFRFNPELGTIEAKSKGQQNWDKFENMMDWTVSKALVFHRWGENYTRQQAFRMMITDAIHNSRMQPEYFSKHGGNDLSPSNWKQSKIAKEAADIALFAVNHFFGEYALHGKARILTGSPGKVNVNGKLLNKMEVGGTWLTSLATGLLHYPMFITDMQSQKVTGAWESVRARDWDSPEMKYLGKYAAFYGFLQLMSVGTNLDLNRLFENDSLELIGDIKREIVGPAPEDLHEDGTLKGDARGYYGVLGKFTGPIVDDLGFGMMALGLMSTPDSDLERMFFGYDHYLEGSGDKDAQNRAWANKMGTFFGFMHNKVVPAIHDGRGWDIARHTFSMYPSTYTKDGRQFVNTYSKDKLGITPFKTPKKKKLKTVKQLEREHRLANRATNAIDLLEQQLRKKSDMGPIQ